MNRRLADFERGSDVLRAAPVEIVEQQRRPKILGKLPDRRLEIEVIGVDAAAWVRLIGRFGHKDFAGFPAAKEIYAKVARDLSDPREELIDIAQTMDSLEYSNESFLRQVFGVMGISDRPIADGQDAPGVTPDQAGIGLAVAFATCRHQFLI
jgi:hypothetical protein